jgi:predicted DNA-binding transcriptional regulator AlpA
MSRAEVLALLGVTYVTLYTWIRCGEFPSAIVLGPPEGRRSKIAWRSDEVQAWLEARPRRRLTPLPVEEEEDKKTRRAGPPYA